MGRHRRLRDESSDDGEERMIGAGRRRRVQFSEDRHRHERRRVKRRIEVDDDDDDDSIEEEVEGEEDRAAFDGADPDVAEDAELLRRAQAASGSDSDTSGFRGVNRKDSDDEDDDEEEEFIPKRLTSRQRMLKEGSKDTIEPLMELDAEERDEAIISRNEAKFLHKQQQARLRRITHEKRKEEKRAATIEKVLRGVTGKKKKQNQEAEQAAVEREQKHQVKESSVRIISNRDMDIVAFPINTELPACLRQGKREYPLKLPRDEQTGKLVRTNTEIP